MTVRVSPTGILTTSPIGLGGDQCNPCCKMRSSPVPTGFPKRSLTATSLGSTVKKPEPKKNLVDHSEFGEIEIVEMPRVKRLAAPLLSESWRTIPHVTHHDEADVTELENFRKNLKDGYTGEQKKITPLAFIIKALVKSMMKYPVFNSSIKYNFYFCSIRD